MEPSMLFLWVDPIFLLITAISHNLYRDQTKFLTGKGEPYFFCFFMSFYTKIMFMFQVVLYIACPRLIFTAVIQGVLSQTFRELPEIISQKYTMSEITFMVRTSIWNFVHVPKVCFSVHRHKVSAKKSLKQYDFCNTQILRENLGELAKL